MFEKNIFSVYFQTNNYNKKFMFIVFEWVDGCGKDTQLEKTFSYLRKKNKNIQIWTTKEPTANTESGRKILEKLSWEGFKDWHEALKLYVADREEQTTIRKNIIEHSTILSSRFDYSTFAFQWAQWLSFEEIYAAHNYEQILIPDLTFIFDVSIENIEKRLANRGGKKEFFEQLDFLAKVKTKYLETAEQLEKERNIIIIDGNKSIDEVFEAVKIELDRYL